MKNFTYTLGCYIFITPDTDLYERKMIDKDAPYFNIGAVDLAYNIALRQDLRLLRWGNGEEFLQNLCFMDYEGIKLAWLKTNPTIRVILNAGVQENWETSVQTKSNGDYTKKYSLKNTTPLGIEKFLETIKKFNLNTV